MFLQFCFAMQCTVKLDLLPLRLYKPGGFGRSKVCAVILDLSFHCLQDPTAVVVKFLKVVKRTCTNALPVSFQVEFCTVEVQTDTIGLSHS